MSAGNADQVGDLLKRIAKRRREGVTGATVVSSWLRRQVQIEGPKMATRGGVNGSRSKFLSKSETSAYVPKSPQALEPRSARIAMNELSRSRRPRSQRGSKMSRNAELAYSDRSDRLHRPVRPVGLEIQIPDRSDRLLRPVRPVASRQPANKAPNVKS